SDSGVLNGFISGFESLCVSLTGQQSAKNQLRTSAATLPPLGTLVMKNNQLLYQADGDGSGIGDVYLVAKAALLDDENSPDEARVAARIAVNVAGQSQFSQGNFAGAGLSVDKKVTDWAALHGDLRVNFALTRFSLWGLPLHRASFGFSVGPELRLARN